MVWNPNVWAEGVWAEGVWADEGEGGSPPVLLDNIPDFSKVSDTGTYQLDTSQYFSGATSYAIDPAVETGWSFDTNTGVLEIDTDDDGVFGPYTVTATNDDGSADSNTFSVSVGAVVGGVISAQPWLWGVFA